MNQDVKIRTYNDTVAQIIYINLDARTDRLAHMEKVLEGCSWKYSRLSATKFITIPDVMRPRMRRGLAGTAAVAAIWTSHLRALKEFEATGGEGIFILLEDDVHIASSFWSDLESHLDVLPDDWEIVLFSPRYRSKQPSENGQKTFVAPPLGEGPNDIALIRDSHHCTGAHFCVFRNTETVLRVIETMENVAEINDVDIFYATTFRTFGITDSRVGAGGLGSDHV